MKSCGRSLTSSARFDITSHTWPFGFRCCTACDKNFSSIALSGSYTAVSIGDVGRAGIQGGLHTIKSAKGCCEGNRSVCSSLIAVCTPKRIKFSVAQRMASSFVSVAIILGMPRSAKMAAITPLPVPISNASRVSGGNSVVLIRFRYSPLMGEKTPYRTLIGSGRAGISTPLFCQA